MNNADDLVPPAHLLLDGSTTPEEFKSVGEGFTRYFLLQHARLQPTEKVLDIGCGIGQKAWALSTYLNESGSYDGIDIMSEGIEWCIEHYKTLPHFRFHHANLYSAHYNPLGQDRASEYRLPYEDATFDLVFLSSVFTHMLPNDIERYMFEIARVLKIGGRTVITFFLLNQSLCGESRRILVVSRSRSYIPRLAE